MLKVAIVGCGKIADSHAAQIQRIPGCEMVGVCDREPLMARQLFERFPIKAWYTNLEEMLDAAKPDVVHITTPAESHFALAKLCIDRGVHAYIEKPFTLYASETRELIALATAKNVKLTVGHDDQYSHVARRMRTLIASGYLGGPAVHMESHFCYQLGHAYAKALMGDSNHWVRKLPGKLLHNIISHGIARISEHLTTEAPKVVAVGFVSPLLKSVGEKEIIDELRVTIVEEERTTAYFTFSSQMRPTLHTFSVYGPKNGILLNQDHETLTMLRGASYTSYLDKFVPPVSVAKQQLGNLVTNAKLFLQSNFHPKAGMHGLIEAFYRSIGEETPLPIPYAEILRTAVIMDEIFSQISGAAAKSMPLASTHSYAD